MQLIPKFLGALLTDEFRFVSVHLFSFVGCFSDDELMIKHGNHGIFLGDKVTIYGGHWWT